MRSVEILSSDQFPLWNRFVASSPQGSVFQTSPFIEAYCSVFGHSSEILAVVGDDAILGGVVLFLKRKGPISAIMTPPMMPYNGIMFAQPVEKKYSRELKDNLEIMTEIAAAVQHKAHYISFVNSPMLPDVRPFQWNKWDVGLRYTLVNRITNLDEAYETLTHGVRRRIRKSCDEHIRFERLSEINSVIRLEEMSYVRSGIAPPVSNDLLHALCVKLLPSGSLRLYGALQPDGTVSAAQAVISSGQTAYLWFFGRLEIENRENGSSFLFWEIFRALAAEGIETVDLIGANTPSIAEFKRSFGGSLMSYYDVSRYRTSALRILIGANNLVHKIRRRL